MTGQLIMIVAGGTGGHVFPGLAVAEALRAGSNSVVWMGTRKGLEARLVPQAGIEIEWITISGIRGRGFAAWLAAPFKLAVAICQAIAAMHRRRPAAVLGLGGFVSGPGGLAAWLTGRPLVIHEQNAIAGTANRWLARLTSHVFEAFPGSFAGRHTARTIGNPVREAIAALEAPRTRFTARAGQRVRLLVVGGSQGARALNELVPKALALLPADSGVDVWHQAGAVADTVRDAYRDHVGEVRVEAFIDDMSAAYAWADLVVCRAGALTVSELCAAGIGAVLIPFPYAIDDHQAKNAASFASGGAGIVIAESDLDPGRFANELAALVADRSALLAMAERAREQARPDAAATLASACLELAEGRA